MSLTVFWYRRDLRIEDNAGLYEALKAENSVVQPVFIFDSDILARFPNPQDRRVSFIYEAVRALKAEFQERGSDLWVFHGKPADVFRDLLERHSIEAVHCNQDYEPLAQLRDEAIKGLCQAKGTQFHTFKDQVIFEKDEVLTDSRKPYTVYTPYKKKWLASLNSFYLQTYPTEKYLSKLNRSTQLNRMPNLHEVGYEPVQTCFEPPAELNEAILQRYKENRDYPALNATSMLGIHLRFGTLSIREVVRKAKEWSDAWLSELIWREFFVQILFHFPHAEKSSFRPGYENIEWRNSPADFERWREGQTGYPIVDAGMRQINQTGFMHNRVRMITASFLTKHLLFHWSAGEKHFASLLLDYELASNNGNWQWAAGTGCDAAPYFRIFNPEAQTKKFDPDLQYIRRWVPELGTSRYPTPMIDHKMARERALTAYSKGLKGVRK